jgi:hypothetical protein
MEVDTATTGPKHIARLVERGLVTIEDRSAEDLRKDFVLPTDRLITLVEAELYEGASLFAYLMSPDRRREFIADAMRKLAQQYLFRSRRTRGRGFEQLAHASPRRGARQRNRRLRLSMVCFRRVHRRDLRNDRGLMPKCLRKELEK